MKSICAKLLFISKFNNLNVGLNKSANIVNKQNSDYNVNKINKFDKNLMKVFKINVECNGFDENEDKQRQCYKQLKCFWPKCRYSCDFESQLNQHISHHLNKRQFVCNECNKQFNSCSSLSVHKNSVHSNVRPFVCSESNCQKSFKLKDRLNKHLKIHSTERSFKCDECDRRFRYKELVSKHKRIHSKQISFRCDAIGCERRFRNSKTLKEHKSRFHSGIRSHRSQ